MWDFMDENGSSGEHTSLVGHHEGACHRQPVSEVVNAVGYEVKVPTHLGRKGRGCSDLRQVRMKQVIQEMKNSIK